MLQTEPEIVKISDIVEFANTLATAVRAELSWSQKLRPTVKVSTVKKTGTFYAVSVSVGGNNENLKGMARAFEYGSGIHATRGVAAKYIIAPKNRKYLAFQWKGIRPGIFPSRIRNPGRKLIGQLPDGRLLFNYIEHPGVRARPFLHSAYRIIQAHASKTLGLRLVNNVRNSLRNALKAMQSKK